MKLTGEHIGIGRTLMSGAPVPETEQNRGLLKDLREAGIELEATELGARVPEGRLLINNDMFNELVATGQTVKRWCPWRFSKVIT